MRHAMRTLYERYRVHHDMDRPVLQWVGMVGFLAFPAFYFLRRASESPPIYDDFWLRLVATGLCAGLATRKHWPKAVARLYLPYSYGAVFYCLPFLLSFTMLKNQGGTAPVVNMVMAAVIVSLVVDWRNAVVMLFAGYVCSVVTYAATEAAPQVPDEFLMAASGSILVLILGAISHYGQKQAELERMRLAYASIAGSIAHEVRTPLSQLQYLLETLAAQPGRPAEAGDCIAQGQRAVRRGLQAVELTLHQLKETFDDESKWKLVAADDCVRKAVDEFAYESAAQRNCVAVAGDANFVFRGSETTVVLILFNLLRNALHYLPLVPDARITLRVETHPQRRIVVHDTGPGIAGDVMARLFDDFQSVGKDGGTGLGLPFCRRAMQALGGSISCRSKVGSFTEFSLVFPPEPCNSCQPPATLATLPPPAHTMAMELADSLAGYSVLVVDDSAMNRLIASRRLKLLGCSVQEATHGTQALEILRSGARPDAILMDMNMPGLSGPETTRKLRGLRGAVASTPVLLVTADPTAAAREKAFAAGVDAFLLKPLDTALLAAALKKHVLRLPR